MNNILLLDVYNINKNNVYNYLYKISNYFYTKNLIISHYFVISSIKMIEDFLKKYEIYVNSKNKKHKLSIIVVSCFIIIQKFCDDLHFISLKDISSISDITKDKLIKYENKILNILDYNIIKYIN